MGCICLDVPLALVSSLPSWLDVVHHILHHLTIIGSSLSDVPARTYDGLPMEDPLSTLLSS